MSKQKKTSIVFVSGISTAALTAANSTLPIWPRALMAVIVAALVAMVVMFSVDSRKLW